ncbi:MAG: HigA family addiction module antidote protein [Nitrospinae bacterium]|nr:HigA family addiction module antidote protein [Nitrospinota bacterium]
MAILNNIPRKIMPSHPGEMLREDFMPDHGLSTSDLARKLCVSKQTVNELLNGRRSLSTLMALRLSQLFGNSPEFWLNAQREVDLWLARKNHKRELAGIRSFG